MMKLFIKFNFRDSLSKKSLDKHTLWTDKYVNHNLVLIVVNLVRFERLGCPLNLQKKFFFCSALNIINIYLEVFGVEVLRVLAVVKTRRFFDYFDYYYYYVCSSSIILK